MFAGTGRFSMKQLVGIIPHDQNLTIRKQSAIQNSSWTQKGLLKFVFWSHCTTPFWLELRRNRFYTLYRPFVCIPRSTLTLHFYTFTKSSSFWVSCQLLSVYLVSSISQHLQTAVVRMSPATKSEQTFFPWVNADVCTDVHGRDPLDQAEFGFENFDTVLCYSWKGLPKHTVAWQKCTLMNWSPSPKSRTRHPNNYT